MKLSVGYPKEDVELQIIREANPLSKLSNIQPVVKLQEIIFALKQVKRAYIPPEVGKLIINIVIATRNNPRILLGCSTRSAIHLTNCSRTLVHVKGRDFVIPEDVLYVAPYVLSHRIITKDYEDAHSVINEILTEVKLP